MKWEFIQYFIKLKFSLVLLMPPLQSQNMLVSPNIQLK